MKSCLRFDAKQHALSVAVILVQLSTAFIRADDTHFKTLSLPYGVKVDAPKNWWIISGDLNTSIETAGEAALDLSGADVPRGRKINLFQASSMPKTTYAGIVITATDAGFSEENLRDLTAADLAKLTLILHDTMSEVLARGNLSVLDFYPVERTQVSGHSALLVSFRRTGPQGPVIVRMTRLVLASKETSINLSYRESEAGSWKPIISHIERSLRVDR